jgi:hypothetical protein
MLEFINNLFSSGFMPIFTAMLLSLYGIIEYMIEGKKRKMQSKENITLLKDKNTKEAILYRISFLKRQSKFLKFGNEINEKIEKIENEVKNAGPVTASIPHFW